MRDWWMLAGWWHWIFRIVAAATDASLLSFVPVSVSIPAYLCGLCTKLLTDCGQWPWNYWFWIWISNKVNHCLCPCLLCLCTHLCLCGINGLCFHSGCELGFWFSHLWCWIDRSNCFIDWTNWIYRGTGSRWRSSDSSPWSLRSEESRSLNSVSGSSFRKTESGSVRYAARQYGCG